jgi:hypothetical protein
MPQNLPDAMALLGQLVGDPNLITGLVTVAVVLVASGLITALILSAWTRR